MPGADGEQHHVNYKILESDSCKTLLIIGPGARKLGSRAAERAGGEASRGGAANEENEPAENDENLRGLSDPVLAQARS